MKVQNGSDENADFLKTWESGLRKNSSGIGSIKRNVKCDKNHDRFGSGNFLMKSEHKFD